MIAQIQSLYSGLIAQEKSLLGNSNNNSSAEYLMVVANLKVKVVNRADNQVVNRVVNQANNQVVVVQVILKVHPKAPKAVPKVPLKAPKAARKAVLKVPPKATRVVVKVPPKATRAVVKAITRAVNLFPTPFLWDFHNMIHG